MIESGHRPSAVITSAFSHDWTLKARANAISERF